MTRLETKRHGLNLRLAKMVLERAIACDEVYACDGTSDTVSNASYILDEFNCNPKFANDSLQDYSCQMSAALQLPCNRFDWKYFKETVANLANEIKKELHF